MNNIFVGNLSFQSTKDDVRKLFEAFGIVIHVDILLKKKGTSRGFGFVDMPNDEERAKAIAALNGKEFMGRELSVSIVVPKNKLDKPKKPKGGSKTWMTRDKKPWDKKEEGGRERFSGKFNRRDDRPSGFKKSFRREDESKPWVKKEGGFKNSSRDDRPRRSDDRESFKKPYRRDDESKPWVKKEGGFKSSSRDDRPRRSDDRGSFKKPYRRDDESKPWAKKEGAKHGGYKPSYEQDEPEGKPYVRREREDKPWLKMKSGAKPAFKKFDGPKPFPKKEGYGKPSEKPFGKPSGKPFGKPFGKPSGKPFGKSFGKPSGKPFGKPSGKPGDAFKNFDKIDKPYKPWPKKGEPKS